MSHVADTFCPPFSQTTTLCALHLPVMDSRQVDEHQLELELLRRVLVEDSRWLDTYQRRALQKIDDGKPCRITLLTDQENSNASPNEKREQSSEQSCSMSAHPYDSSGPSCRQACAYSIEGLPAPEFISGAKSLVTSESLRLLHRAAVESSMKQSIHFKRPV